MVVLWAKAWCWLSLPLEDLYVFSSQPLPASPCSPTAVERPTHGLHRPAVEAPAHPRVLCTVLQVARGRPPPCWRSAAAPITRLPLSHRLSRDVEVVSREVRSGRASSEVGFPQQSSQAVIHQQSAQAGGEAKDLIEGDGDKVGLVNRQVQRRGAHKGGRVQQHKPLPRPARRAPPPGLDLAYPGQRVSGSGKVTLGRVAEEMRRLAGRVPGRSRVLSLGRPHVLWPDGDGRDVHGRGDLPHAHHRRVAVGEVTEAAATALRAWGHPRESLCHQLKSSRAPGGENHRVVLRGGVEVRQDPGRSTASGHSTVSVCIKRSEAAVFLLNKTSLHHVCVYVWVLTQSCLTLWDSHGL